MCLPKQPRAGTPLLVQLGRFPKPRGDAPREGDFEDARKGGNI